MMAEETNEKGKKATQKNKQHRKKIRAFKLGENVRVKNPDAKTKKYIDKGKIVGIRNGGRHIRKK